MAASATVSHGSSRLRRCIIAIEGVVQGIGFRPAVYRLAVRHGLGGSVRNSLQGVLVDVEGDETMVASFVAELDALAPGSGRRASITWPRPRGRAGARAAAPTGTAAAALRDGGIVGIKGIGGYHLACDATNAGAIGELRGRKRREAKPLAVMVKDLTAARALCRVSDAEARLLASPARPIVPLTKRADATPADGGA